MQTGDEVAVKLVSHSNVLTVIIFLFFLSVLIKILCVFCARNLRGRGILNFIMSQSSICSFKEEVSSFFLSFVSSFLFLMFF